MKRIVSLLLLISLALALVSCSDNEYPPVASTDEELRTVITLNIDNMEYEVKYELYRALFLTYKSAVDKGDESVWTGAEKQSYVDQIDSMIIDAASEIYAALHICNKIGVDVYSKVFDARVEKYIAYSVEGGIIDSNVFMGFGGDYDAYLASLAAMGVNYAVQDLLFRYSFAVEEINKYYAGNIDDSSFAENVQLGAIKYTEEDVRSFYKSSECVRVIYAKLSTEAYSATRAKEVRDVIASKGNDEDVSNYIIGHTTLGASDVKYGMLIAMHSLDNNYYGEMTSAAFALKNFETSEVIEVRTGSERYYVIMYRTVKSDDFFENKYDEIVNVYLQNEIGKILDEAIDTLADSAVKSEYLNGLSRGDIKAG